MKNNTIFTALIFSMILFSCSPKKVNTDNPLMIAFNTPLQAVPFDKIRPEHYKPAFESAMADARTTLEKIITASEKPTFTNTIEALEHANYSLKRIEQVFFNINSAETSKEIQQIAQEISPVLTEFYNDITLNEALFGRVKQIYNDGESLDLTAEQRKLLEDTYKERRQPQCGSQGGIPAGNFRIVKAYTEI